MGATATLTVSARAQMIPAADKKRRKVRRLMCCLCMCCVRYITTMATGFCGEWHSENAAAWTDTCHGLDFLRVSPGCGIEVATEPGGNGERFEYDGSVLVCGYPDCEHRPTPGCDRVRSIRLFRKDSEVFTGIQCPVWRAVAISKCPQWLSGGTECYQEPTSEDGLAICAEWSANAHDNECFRATVAAGIEEAFRVACSSGTASVRKTDT